MRNDNGIIRTDSLRQRMGWLHAWVGFIAGVVSVVIFTCGALAVYDTELTRWMQPELSRTTESGLTPGGLKKVLHEIDQLQRIGRTPLLILPSARDPFMRVVTYNGTSFLGSAYDPHTGDHLSDRKTYGGTFFFVFHHGLFLPKPWGSIPTELAGLALIVTVGSGIVIQLKNFLPDFLRLRLRGTQLRGWTDAHILVGLLLLPYMFMMAYTGTATHAARLFPKISPQKSRIEAARAATPVSGHDAVQLLHEIKIAKSFFGGSAIGFVAFKDKQTILTQSDMSNTVITRDNVTFTPTDPGGTLMRHPGGLSNVKGWLAGFHFARWAPYSVRFLYFIGGLAGSWLMSAGLIIFSLKRRAQNAHRRGFQIGEAATIGVTVGLPLAAITYIASSRFPLGSVYDRTFFEVFIFFMTWLAACAHALRHCFMQRPQCAWLALSLALGVAALALPCLDLLTRAPTFKDVSKVYVVTDIAFGIFGMCVLVGARCLARRCS